MGFVSAIFRNILGKPGAADFRDSADHFVSVLREHGIALTFARDELRYVDDLAARLAAHPEYRDALGCASRQHGRLLPNRVHRVQHRGCEWRD